MQTIGRDYEFIEEAIFDITDMDRLIDTYPNDNLINSFKKLQTKYPFYRPIKGDGNCFYRAIAFLHLRETDLS